MGDVKIVTVASIDALRRETLAYASKGYSTIQDEGNRVALSRRKRFNWLLMIILLFIPIIGWFALGMMLMAGRRGSDVVEIRVQQQIPETVAS